MSLSSLVNDKIVEWINKQETKGYSEEQLKLYLLKKGYSTKDIDEAVVYSKKTTKSAKFDLKKIFTPTLLKLIIPIMVFLLVLLSFFANSYTKDFVGDADCKIVHEGIALGDANRAIQDATLKNDTDPDTIVQMLQYKDSIGLNATQWVIDNFSEMKKKSQILYLGNFHLLFSGIYQLDPFFPVPCEPNYGYVSADEKSTFCKYYISEENYNCVYARNTSPDDAALGSAGNFASKPYEPISFTTIFIHGLILSVMFYILVCIMSYIVSVLREKSNKFKVLFSGIIVAVTISLLGILNYYNEWYIDLEIIICISIILAIVIIAFFIRDDKHEKIFLTTMAILLVLALIVSSFLINYSVLGLQSGAPPSIDTIRYTVDYCNNTGIIQIYNGTGYENQTVCENPRCQDICINKCDTKNYASEIELSGTKHSCICGCVIKK